MTVTPQGLISVLCPGTREVKGDTVSLRLCSWPLGSYPCWYGRAETKVIADMSEAHGDGEVKRCRNCKQWVQVSFPRLIESERLRRAG